MFRKNPNLSSFIIFYENKILILSKISFVDKFYHNYFNQNNTHYMRLLLQFFVLNSFAWFFRLNEIYIYLKKERFYLLKKFMYKFAVLKR